MTRVHQIVLIVSTLALSWFGMMAVHELGHVLGAWAIGGRVAKVVLHPLTISRTDLAENPQPLVVVWAGPVFGVLAPLLAWSLAQQFLVSISFLTRFFAGFCLIANGAYLGIGSFAGVGDAGDLLHHGATIWHLWLFGAICVPSGLASWHRLGPHFGLGDTQVQVDLVAAYGCFFALVATVVLMAFLGGE